MIMKISKLFHWLYASLMFLPLIMFLPSCLYYSLNKYATNETTTEVTNKYQSNEVNTLDDLVDGNIYELDTIYLSYNNDDFVLELNVLSFNCNDTVKDYLTNSNDLFDVSFDNYYDNLNSFIKLSIDSGEMILSFPNSNNLNSTFVYTDYDIQLNNIIFYLNEVYLEDFKLWFNNYGNNLPQYTDYNVIESVDTNVQETITNKVSNAWESIWNLPLFAWTKNSFISAPFTYITGLFGLASTNSLNYLFTYFCSISICWLVFDVLMYVPNLAHRWLDKGAIE